MFRFLLTSAGIVALGIGAFKLLKKKSENQDESLCQTLDEQGAMN